MPSRRRSKGVLTLAEQAERADAARRVLLADWCRLVAQRLDPTVAPMPAEPVGDTSVDQLSLVVPAAPPPPSIATAGHKTPGTAATPAVTIGVNGSRSESMPSGRTDAAPVSAGAAPRAESTEPTGPVLRVPATPHVATASGRTLQVTTSPTENASTTTEIIADALAPNASATSGVATCETHNDTDASAYTRLTLSPAIVESVTESASAASPAVTPAAVESFDPVAALGLAPRLEQTLLALLAGRSEKEVARQLALSPHTVHTYVKQLHKRLGVNSRGELLAKFISHQRPALNR